MAAGTCRICGCTDESCMNCLIRSGVLCSWATPEEDLCTGCEPIAAVVATAELFADALDSDEQMELAQLANLITHLTAVVSHYRVELAAAAERVGADR
jgi:hypothetical protein